MDEYSLKPVLEKEKEINVRESHYYDSSLRKDQIEKGGVDWISQHFSGIRESTSSQRSASTTYQMRTDPL
jgi:hypothetical protein